MSKNDTSVQQKLVKLDELVAWFDSDEFVLEEAIARYHEAEKLAEEIEHDLTTLKNEIVVLKQKFDQNV